MSEVVVDVSFLHFHSNDCFVRKAALDNSESLVFVKVGLLDTTFILQKAFANKLCWTHT